MNKTLDEIDRTILRCLQVDARITNIELAHRVQLSPPGLQKRLRKLEESGIIDQYAALVNREKLGFDLLCIVHINLERHELDAVHKFKEAVQEMPEVLECYHITGESDYLLKVIIRNRKHLEEFIVDTLTPAPGVGRILTSLVLSDIKETTAIPLELVQG